MLIALQPPCSWLQHPALRLLSPCKQKHPDEPMMKYQEFFVERQNARYAIGKSSFRGCC
jgi:hypothetical protein